jgi:hypothetical protein
LFILKTSEEAFMDLATCIQSKDGTVYCWDNDKHSWVKFRTTDVAYKDLPADVIEKLTQMAVTNLDGQKKPA